MMPSIPPPSPPPQPIPSAPPDEKPSRGVCRLEAACAVATLTAILVIWRVGCPRGATEDSSSADTRGLEGRIASAHYRGLSVGDTNESEWSSSSPSPPPATSATVGGAGRVQYAQLYGGIYGTGYYYLDLLIGSPVPQRQSVILDTGSTILAFPCKNCLHCGSHIDSPFDFRLSQSAEWESCHHQDGGTQGEPSLSVWREGGEPLEWCPSSACRHGRCSYRQGYTEGSQIVGYWFSDFIQLGDRQQDNPPVKAFAGCHSEENKLFRTQKASGILGIASRRQSDHPTFLDAIFDTMTVPRRAFSICLAEEGGLLTVGGWSGNSSSEFGGGEGVWTSMVPSVYYAVTIQGGWVGDVRLGWGTEEWVQAIVDSGTTYTYLPKSVWPSFRALFLSLCPPDSGGNNLRGSSPLTDTIRHQQTHHTDNDKDGTFISPPPLSTTATTTSSSHSGVGPIPGCRRLHSSVNEGVAADNTGGDTAGGPSGGDMCWSLKGGRSTAELFPTIHLQFKGGKVPWRPTSYLHARGSDHIWCLAVDDNRRQSAVLGMSFMVGHEVIVDKQRQLVGFVEAHCPSYQDRPTAPSRVGVLPQEGVWIALLIGVFALIIVCLCVRPSPTVPAANRTINGSSGRKVYHTMSYRPIVSYVSREVPSAAHDGMAATNGRTHGGLP